MNRTNCSRCFDCLDEPSLSPLENPTATRLIICYECGNKRCPHGTNHDNACTGSNEPGQPGSRYGGLPETPESNLRQIKSAGPVLEVVALLEDLLERARSGEVIGVAVAAACNGRADATVYELGEGSVSSLHLGLCRMQRRLLDIE